MDVTTYLPTLINALGHLGGITAFGAFLLLLRRSVRTGSRAETGLPAAAAGLAVCWNAGSLAVLFSSPGSGASQILASLSFAVLSLLPCVLLHLALGTEYRWLRHGGYAVGGVASLSHLSEAFDFPMASHEVGVGLITYGFGALAIVAAVLLSRGRADHRAAGMRAFAAISLFLLAASFVHFGAEHGPGSWAHELLFHHAGIPLALFVLLQDYRFLLLDVFIRLLGAFLLAALFAAALLVLGGQLGLFEPRETGAPQRCGVPHSGECRDRRLPSCARPAARLGARGSLPARQCRRRCPEACARCSRMTRTNSSMKPRNESRDSSPPSAGGFLTRKDPLTGRK